MTPRVALAALVTSLFACADVVDVAEYHAAADGLDGTQITTSLLALIAEPTNASASADAAVVAASQRALVDFQPPSCVRAGIEGQTVNYTFTDCAGPFGLARMSGVMRATWFNRSANGWTVQLTGEVTIGRALHRTNLTAAVSYADTVRTAMVTVSGNGTGPRGTSYATSGTYTATWDAGCVGVDGTLMVAAGGLRLAVTPNNWRRCHGACPTAGASLGIVGPLGASTITASGGPSAMATGPRGAATVTLFCGN
jgi:hypothetical protein